MRFAHETAVGLRLDAKHLVQAGVHEHVLAPSAELGQCRHTARRPLAGAGSVVRREGMHGAAREHLDGPVQAVPAVAQVAGRGVVPQHHAQPAWEEDGIGVDLDRPRGGPPEAITDDPPPDRDENPGVPGDLVELALEVGLHNGRLDPWADRQHLVAVHRGPVTGEDARLEGVLRREQLWLVARWLYEGEAEERGAWRATPGARPRAERRLRGGRLRRHGGASPLCLGRDRVIQMDALLAALPAAGPGLVLHVALEARVAAAAGDPAVLECAGTVLRRCHAPRSVRRPRPWSGHRLRAWPRLRQVQHRPWGREAGDHPGPGLASELLGDAHGAAEGTALQPCVEPHPSLARWDSVAHGTAHLGGGDVVERKVAVVLGRVVAAPLDEAALAPEDCPLLHRLLRPPRAPRRPQQPVGPAQAEPRHGSRAERRGQRGGARAPRPRRPRPARLCGPGAPGHGAVTYGSRLGHGPHGGP
mmetsp:Transcript_13598/g.42019  ORF Transcript_13598/g.42019 Transcript_13598/m.42019 type:complete len:474 (+) Transcript_13598:272-1693(+)